MHVDSYKIINKINKSKEKMSQCVEETISFKRTKAVGQSMDGTASFGRRKQMDISEFIRGKPIV